MDETKTRGDAVSAGAGDWVAYRDAALGEAARTFTAWASREAAGVTTLQVRLDDPETGPIVGTARVPSTGDRYDYTAVRTDLTDAGGRPDVDLVPTGDSGSVASPCGSEMASPR